MVGCYAMLIIYCCKTLKQEESMRILNSIVNQGEQIFYTSKYRQMIEDHVIFLRNHKTVTTVSLAPMLSYRYMADFYGLLFHLNLQPEFHYSVLRLNGYKSPLDFKGTESSILMFDVALIKRLTNTLKTQIKKS